MQIHQWCWLLRDTRNPERGHETVHPQGVGQSANKVDTASLSGSLAQIEMHPPGLPKGYAWNKLEVEERFSFQKITVLQVLFQYVAENI